MRNSRNSKYSSLHANISIEMVCTVSTLPLQGFVDRSPQDSFPYLLKFYLQHKWIHKIISPKRFWVCPICLLSPWVQKPRGKAVVCSQGLHRAQEQCTWPGTKHPVAESGCFSLWISTNALPDRRSGGGGCSSFQWGAAVPPHTYEGAAVGLRGGRGPLCGLHSSSSVQGWMMTLRPVLPAGAHHFSPAAGLVP